MVMALDGWMDGGEISTGTAEYLLRKLDAARIGEIDSEDFYILSFPGPMEVSALFRPHTRIRDGSVVSLSSPQNVIYCSQAHNLVFLKGREPNLRWSRYLDEVLDLAVGLGVTLICFVGSVAGMVPHTREPRYFASISDPTLRPMLDRCGIKLSNYEGPASIITQMILAAPQRDIRMMSLVAEIPAYVQGRNARCIESAVRKVAGLLDLSVEFDDLRQAADELEKKLNDIVEGREELATYIKKLEEDYDNQVFDTQMGDLKQWLEQQGIRLD